MVGLSSSVLFDKTQPDNPINRRISIVVMTKAAEAAALAGSGQEVALSPTAQDADIQATQGAPAVPVPVLAPAAAPASASP
ncbi:hypothetical protein D9M72_629730 [compost metagenome]